MKVLLPISLDQWRSPIASLLRAVVEYNPGHHFESFSNPTNAEDRQRGERFWALPQIELIHPLRAGFGRYDLIHTASLNPRNLAIARFCKLRGFGRTRFLTTINLEIDPELGARDWGSYRRAVPMADFMVAVSEASARRPRADIGDRFLGVIPNGFDASLFDPSADCAADWPAGAGQPDPRYALFVSALEPRKHPELVLELARLLPGVRFLAAGWEHPVHHGEFLPMMASQPNLRWLGHLEQRQLRALMKHAGVLVFPSDREGLPLTVIEAHGMGLPVIAQPKSSLPELITDGVNGRLIDAGDIDGWCEAVSGYLGTGESVRELLAREIRARAAGQYDWPVIGRRYAELYRRLEER